MKKRFFSLLVLMVMLVCLLVTGCLPKNCPDDFSPASYEIGVQALELMNQYINGDLDQKSVNSSMWKLVEQLNQEIAALDSQLEEEPENPVLLVHNYNAGAVSYQMSSFVLGAKGEENYDCNAIRDTLQNLLHK